MGLSNPAKNCPRWAHFRYRRPKSDRLLEFADNTLAQLCPYGGCRVNTEYVYIVDDDEAIRDSLAWLMTSTGLEPITIASGEACLEIADSMQAGCVLLDVRMDGISGLQVFENLKTRKMPLPVIFLTGHGDVPMAVEALKSGAFDFLEKPFSDNDLVLRVQAALATDRVRRSNLADQAEVQVLLAQLSPREREVMVMILASKLNKVIADELEISMRTVEVHRARIFAKWALKARLSWRRFCLMPG